jgi:hypothetical protein
MGKCTHVQQAEELATHRNSIRPPRFENKGPPRVPLVDKGPHGYWRTATFLAMLRKRSHRGAPCLIGGPINGDRFLVYVEQFLAPTLKPTTSWWPYNLGSQKERPFTKRSSSSQVLARPNPIEQVFPNQKTLVRRAAPRTFSSPPRTPSQCALGGKEVYCPPSGLKGRQGTATREIRPSSPAPD